MSRILLLLCALLSAPAVHADWGFEFLRVSCNAKENFFEAKEEVLFGLDDIQFEFDKVKRDANVRAYAANQSLYLVAGYKQRVSCTLSDGTKIRLRTNPNPADEHNLFPGASATLVVNGKAIFSDLSFPTDCEHTLIGVTIDKARGDFAFLTMRSNVDYKPYVDFPTEAAIGIKTSYDSKTDALKIRNCRSTRSPQR
jgi:hypothetical protein